MDEGYQYRYCVRTSVSVAMEIPEWNYEAHGHDLFLIACFLSKKKINIDKLSKLLKETASKYDHKPLWKTIGEGALIEDLLEDLYKNLKTKTSRDISLSNLEACIPSGCIGIIPNEKTD